MIKDKFLIIQLFISQIEIDETLLNLTMLFLCKPLMYFLHSAAVTQTGLYEFTMQLIIKDLYGKN